jgi:hypothetical protein
VVGVSRPRTGLAKCRTVVTLRCPHPVIVRRGYPAQDQPGARFDLWVTDTVHVFRPMAHSGVRATPQNRSSSLGNDSGGSAATTVWRPRRVPRVPALRRSPRSVRGPGPYGVPASKEICRWARSGVTSDGARLLTDVRSTFADVGQLEIDASGFPAGLTSSARCPGASTGVGDDVDARWTEHPGYSP